MKAIAVLLLLTLTACAETAFVRDCTPKGEFARKLYTQGSVYWLKQEGLYSNRYGQVFKDWGWVRLSKEADLFEVCPRKSDA